MSIKRVEPGEPGEIAAALRAELPRDDQRITVESRQRADAWESTHEELSPDTIDGWAAYAAEVLRGCSATKASGCLGWTC